MVGHVQQSGSYFHVSCDHPYNKFPRLAQGLTINVGIDHNNFFSFYENSITTKVNTPSGQIDVKAIRFLSAVANKEINPDYNNYPQFAQNVAQHYLMLARELIMEEVRLQINSSFPSRKTCLWMVETIDEARYWRDRLGKPAKIFVLETTGSIHHADASLLLGDSEPLSVTYDRARQYWQGFISKSPEKEVIFSGSALVKAIVS